MYCRDIGHAEKRLTRLPHVILRYTAATGLSNQHYCHIAAFSLCAVLGRCSVSFSGIYLKLADFTQDSHLCTSVRYCGESAVHSAQCNLCLQCPFEFCDTDPATPALKVSFMSCKCRLLLSTVLQHGAPQLQSACKQLGSHCKQSHHEASNCVFHFYMLSANNTTCL